MKKNIVLFSILSILILAVFTVNAALAATGALNALNNTANYAGFETVKAGEKAELKVVNFLGSIIGFLLGFIGVIFMILIIYAGFLWMTARGNESQVEKSKNIIKSSFIGLIIVFAAFAIAKTVGLMMTTFVK